MMYISFLGKRIKMKSTPVAFKSNNVNYLGKLRKNTSSIVWKS